MKLFYKAIAQNGRKVQGFIEAKDVQEAALHLRSRQFFPISIVERKENQLFKLIPGFNRTGRNDLIFFTRQLSSMLTSGLTLIQALTIMKEQVENLSMIDIVSGIITDIEEGKSFSLAITKHPLMFSPIYVSLIKAAETSGLLDKILLRLSDNLEKEARLRSTIRSALLYPSIIVIGMVIVVAIMMIVVIPQLSVLYENLNIPLPLATQIVVGMSEFTKNFWLILLGLLVLFLFLFRRWHKTEVGKLIVDDFILRLPIFGKLTKQTIQAEFTRTLGLLISSGTLVVEALTQTSYTAGNVRYRNAINGVAKRVERGVTVGDAMSYYPLFAPILVQMVKIGEQTGKIDESLIKVSEYFEREVEQVVKTLTTALEPIIMVVLGAGIAFLIISIITPIYNLTSSIQ